MKLFLHKGDITTLKVDAIVNAANAALSGGSGVDGAIHRAGGPEITKACDKIRARQGGCPTGQAVITTGGLLPARHVIHTVGPIWRGTAEAEKLLAECYRSSLVLASKHELTSIAFPNISTGIYRFPKEAAAAIAVQTVQAFGEITSSVKEVHFVCFDEENYQLYRSLLANHL